MEIIGSIAISSGKSVGVKKYSSGIRFWHWANALVITGSLLTVLINSTVLHPWSNAGFIADKLKEKGVNITDEQARPVAFALSDKIWAVHTYLGYVLAGLLLFRIGLELFEVADKKLIRKIKAARRSFLSRQESRSAARNEIIIKTLYALFYIFLIIMVTTGLCLAFQDNVPLLHSMHFIKEIHGFTMYLIIGFIVIHLAGVFLGERRQGKGIVSDMINGGETRADQN